MKGLIKKILNEHDWVDDLLDDESFKTPPTGKKLFNIISVILKNKKSYNDFEYEVSYDSCGGYIAEIPEDSYGGRYSYFFNCLRVDDLGIQDYKDMLYSSIRGTNYPVSAEYEKLYEDLSGLF